MNEIAVSLENNQTIKPSKNRRRKLLVLLLIIILLSLAYTGYWWLSGQYYESTDDAYVSGDIVQVSSATGGIVTAVNVDNTQNVTRGTTLIELDPANAIVQRDRAEAQLAHAVRSVRGQFAQARQAEARRSELTVALKQAQSDQARRSNLVAAGAVGGEEVMHLAEKVTALRAQLDAANAQIAVSLAPIDHTSLEHNPDVLAAAANVRDAALNLTRSKVVASVDGTVAMRNVHVGAQIAAGTPLLSIVPLDGVWIEANFKETQLAHMRIGQPVLLRSDLYGRGHDYHGRVVGISAGSGSAFALIPPQNASGNWIKVVQRVPVRILIDPTELRAHPLRQGLSMQVRVDLHDQSGPLVAGVVRNIPSPARASDGHDPAVEAKIQQIIHANESS